MIIVTTIRVGVSAAAIIIGSPHVWVATTVVSVLGIAATVAIADHSAASGSPGFKPPLAMSAVIDGHTTLGMNSADVAAVVEIRAGAILRLQAGLCAVLVEISGVPGGVSHAPSAARGGVSGGASMSCGSGAGMGRGAASSCGRTRVRCSSGAGMGRGAASSCGRTRVRRVGGATVRRGSGTGPGGIGGARVCGGARACC